MVSRALKSEEQELKPFTIARDGVSVILNSANPISELTDQQVIDLYTGKVTDWAEVGGPSGPVTVVNKAEGRSTLELFLHHFKLKASDIKAHVVIGDNQQGIKTVAGNPGAIGYVSVGTAEFEAGHGSRIKLLNLGGVAASTEHVRNGSFPLARPLNLVTKDEPTGTVKDFISFSQSSEVKDLIEDQYFVPLGP